MKKVELSYIEVMNETEQLFVFTTTFNGKTYAQPIIINMALPVEIQNITFQKTIWVLANMTRKDAAGAEVIEPCKCKCGSCKCQE